MNTLNIKALSEQVEKMGNMQNEINVVFSDLNDLDERVQTLEQSSGSAYTETLLGEYDGVTHVTIGVVDYTIYDAFMVLFSGNYSNGFTPIMFPKSAFFNGKAYNKASDGDVLIMSLTDGTNIDISGAGSYGFIYKVYGINY